MKYVPAALALITAYLATAQDRMIGRALLIDDDKIEVGGEPLRFNGIDAPRAGRRAKTGLGMNIIGAGRSLLMFWLPSV